MNLGQTSLVVMVAATPTEPVRSACTRLVFGEDRNPSPPPMADGPNTCAKQIHCHATATRTCVERMTCRHPSPPGFRANQPEVAPALVAGGVGQAR